MCKQAFLKKLKRKLSKLPKAEALERLAFYSEMIDDRIEEGLTEEEAVQAIGSADEIAGEILAEYAPNKKSARKPSTLSIVLLALGSPIWLSLLIAAGAIVLSLYVTLLAVVVSLWAVFVALAVCAPASVVVCIVFACTGKASLGILVLGAGLVCAGIAILLFYACKSVTKSAAYLAAQSFSWTIKLGRKKENA